MPDCNVKSSNKIGTAHGEKKLYIGQQTVLSNFFPNAGFTINVLIKKSDLEQYLISSEYEYLNPSQNYRNKSKFSNLYQERLHLIQEITEENIIVTFKHQKQINGPRAYINTEDQYSDKYWNLIREIALPEISSLAIMKLAYKLDTIYYLKLFLNHDEIIESKDYSHYDSLYTIEERQQIVKVRTGQAQYRKKILKQCPICPMTMVSDTRLLNASYIKPFSYCNDIEKYDPKNGFMFTPTYDRLFDRGFITFNENKEIIVSNWLTESTCKQLQLVNKKGIINLPIEGKEKYLDYHNKIIFKS